jgi:hypothetical protein
MTNELFDISKNTELTAEEIYHLTVCNGAVPIVDYPDTHIEELKKHELVEVTDSRLVHMTRKGMDWLDNVTYCQHTRCSGNYEDVWCMDCGADYNNGRLR